MAEDCVVAEGQDACHPPALIAQPRVPNGIDPAMDSVKSTCGNPLRDATWMESGMSQLRRCDYPMLARRYACDGFVRRRLGEFLPHRGS
jgi:hypothetical protein